jgi:hypothetical protein
VKPPEGWVVLAVVLFVVGVLLGLGIGLFA